MKKKKLTLSEKVKLKTGKLQAGIARRNYTASEIGRVVRSDPNKKTLAHNWLQQGFKCFCPAQFDYKVFRNAVPNPLLTDLLDLERQLFSAEKFESEELRLHHYEPVGTEENLSRAKYVYLSPEHMQSDSVKMFSALAHQFIREQIEISSRNESVVKKGFKCGLLELFDKMTDKHEPNFAFLAYNLPIEMNGIATHSDCYAVWGVAVLLLHDGGSVDGGLQIESVDIKQVVGDIAVIDNKARRSVPINFRNKRWTSLNLWF